MLLKTAYFETALQRKHNIYKVRNVGSDGAGTAHVIREQFSVNSFCAKRLVRTESAYVSNAAVLDGTNLPPMHPFCRSTTIADFGDDTPKDLERRAKDKDGNTVTVPADMTYEEWKETFVDGTYNNNTDDLQLRLTDVYKGGIISEKIISKDEVSDVHYLGKLDKTLYRCVANDITTEDVIITDERIQHIKEHHPGHFEIIEPFLQAAISSPDYILEDAENTGLILKMIEKWAAHSNGAAITHIE